MREEPENCFYIDELPLPVGAEAASRFGEVEACMRASLEKKARRVLTKLWLYNDVYLLSALLPDLEARGRFRLKKLLPPKGGAPIELTRLEQLERALSLSFKDQIDLLLIYARDRLILVDSWSCIFAYVEDRARLESVEKIVNVEGLHLRRYKPV